MKLKLLAVPLVGLGLGLGIPSNCFAATASTTTTPSPSPTPTLTERLQGAESEMDRVFHDAMQDLHLTDNKAQPAKFGSSMDLRENSDAYEARIYVPGADAGSVEVTLKDGTLHIAAGDKTTGRFQESVQLPGPVLADKMKVETKDGFVLATIPKDKATASTAVTTPAAPLPADQWDLDIVRQMQSMQTRMDQLARDAFGNPGDTSALATGQFLDSTVKLDDQKSQYVVHFYLPDANTANLKVNVDNSNVLRLSASNEANKEAAGVNGTESQYASSHYEEQIALPGPVHADKMIVDRKQGVVTVTLPKA